jgi:hypothetical protein
MSTIRSRNILEEITCYEIAAISNALVAKGLERARLRVGLIEAGASNIRIALRDSSNHGPLSSTEIDQVRRS